MIGQLIEPSLSCTASWSSTLCFCKVPNSFFLVFKYDVAPTVEFSCLISDRTIILFRCCHNNVSDINFAVIVDIANDNNIFVGVLSPRLEVDLFQFQTVQSLGVNE